MKGITANLKNELNKLLSRKKYIVFMIIEAAVCAGAACVKILSSRVSGGSFDLSGLNTSMSLLSFFAEAVIPFISIMAVCELFSAEFRDQTIRAVLVRPCQRYKIFLGKVFAVFILALMNISVILTASAIADLTVSRKIVGFGYALGAYIIDAFPILVVILMAVMINQFTKSSTMAMFLCIMIYVGLKIAGIYFSSLGGLLFTGYMQLHRILWGGGMPPVAASFKVLLLVGYGLTFSAVGYYAFKFKEF